MFLSRLVSGAGCGVRSLHITFNPTSGGVMVASYASHKYFPKDSQSCVGGAPIPLSGHHSRIGQVHSLTRMDIITGTDLNIYTEMDLLFESFDAYHICTCILHQMDV